MIDSLSNLSSYQAALIPDPLRVTPTATLVEVVQLMNQARVTCELKLAPTDLAPKILAEARSSCVLVMDGAGTLQGIVTERDLVRLGVEQDDWQTAIAGEVMTSPVLALPLAQLTDMFVVLEQFRLHRIRHLPVLDDAGQVMGLITQSSLRLVTRPIDLMRFQVVADAMTDNVVTASPQTSLLEINHVLVQHRISCVVIVEPHEQLENKVRPVGVITEGDLVQLRSLHLNFADCQVEQAMVQPVVTLYGQDTLLEVQNLMESHQIHQVIVQGEAGELLGIITQTNVLAALNPWELFRLTESLEKRVSLLESEKMALLESRALDLEREVQTRTHSLEEKYQQEQLVNKIANQIRSSLALPEILQTTVIQVLALFACDRVAVWQCDDQGLLTAIAEAKSDQIRSQLNETVDDPCFRENGLEHYVNGKTWVATDLHNEILTDCYRDLMARLQIRAKILVAIVIKGRLWGLLEASESQRARQWSDHEINLLQSLSTQLAIAIDQAQTHQSLADLSHQLERRVLERTVSLEVALQKLQTEVLRRGEIETRQEVLLAELSDFKFALDQAAIVAITDTDGRITYCNDKLCEISGYSRGELIGQTHRVIKSDYHPPEFYAQLWNTITQGNIWKGEICNRTKDGQDYWVNTTIIPFCDPNGQPVQHLSIRVDITPQKQAQQALQRSETNYRRIVETAQEGIWVIDAGTKTVFANQAIAAMLQITVEAMMGRSLFDFISPENHSTAQQLFAKRQAGESERHEFCFQRQDGSPLWTTISASVIFDEDHQFVGCLGMVTDITEQKMAAEVITQQLACIEAAIDGIAVLKDDKYLYLNKSHLTLFGYDDPKQLLGQSWQSLYSSEELRRFETDIFPLLMRDKNWQGEATATRRDGSTFTEELSLTLVEDGGLICVCRDISERKQAEAAIHRTTDELNQFFALALDLLSIANTDGYFLRLNQEWEKTLGYSLEELTSRPLLDFVHPDDLDETLAAIAKLSTGSEIIGFTNRYRCKDGSYRWLEWRGVPRDGIIYSAARDITDRKYNEENLQLTNQALERATHLKDEFLANMSHELRTPLNAVLGLTDAVLEEVFGPINEKQRKALKTVHTSSDHLLSLINDILDLSKIEAGKIDLALTPANIAALCKISLDFVKQLAHQKRIQLSLQIPDNLPELMLDERRIRQVLINLLSNAVKFTPEGGKVNLVVSFSTTSALDDRPADPLPSLPVYWIHFAVIDTGIGITPENLGKLFQPFIQIDSALNRQHAGTGLGLALVKRIVELHGGKVEVSSQVSKGSRFGFALPCPEIVVPLSSLTLSYDDSDTLSKVVTSSSDVTQSVLVLLVEDNEANIQTFSSYLEAKRYRVAVAKDGIDGVEQAKALTPDIILMDIQLPKLDGISAIQQIRAQSALAKTPIIALTALAMKGDRERCLAAGANEYLPKPVKLQSLPQTIQRLLTDSNPV
jgi:PAS domain S-box-containing protein